MVQGLGYTSGGLRRGLDTALNANEVTALYMHTFGNVQVSAKLKTDGEFTPTLALNLGQALASSVPMARAMKRGLTQTVCDPHFVLSLTADSVIPSRAAKEKLLENVRAGNPLPSAQKALLISLPDLRQRAAWSVAWVAKRCQRSMRAASHATLPVSYRPLSSGTGGTLHANLIALTFDPDGTVHLELFEPNGVDAYYAEGLADILAGIEGEMEKWGLLPNGCTFSAVGTGIQTALGEWRFSASGASRRLQQRGYPVCGAVCVWAFAGYVSSKYGTLRDFDAHLHAQLVSSPEERHCLQRQFFDSLTALSAWNDTDGRNELRDAIISNLQATNVLTLTISRGPHWKCRVDFQEDSP